MIFRLKCDQALLTQIDCVALIYILIFLRMNFKFEYEIREYYRENFVISSFKGVWRGCFL